MAITIDPPQASIYLVGLLFVVCSQGVAIPLCVLAHKIRRSPAALYACGLATASLPLFLQPLFARMLLERGYASATDVLLGRFLGATMFAFAALRMWGAAVGATPKGADADVSTWIAFATASTDTLFDEDGKPKRPAKGAMLRRLVDIALRMTAVSVISSIAHPQEMYPALAYVTRSLGSGSVSASMYPALALAYVVDHVLVQLVLIWLFLSLLMDVGAILLLAQNYETLQGFDNPVFNTLSPRDFWGKKWNIQVTTSFKRCVFKPLRQVGLSPTYAALVTFVSVRAVVPSNPGSSAWRPVPEWSLSSRGALLMLTSRAAPTRAERTVPRVPVHPVLFHLHARPHLGLLCDARPLRRSRRDGLERHRRHGPHGQHPQNSQDVRGAHDVLLDRAALCQHLGGGGHV